jgi:hypothetical protein
MGELSEEKRTVKFKDFSGVEWTIKTEKTPSEELREAEHEIKMIKQIIGSGKWWKRWDAKELSEFARPWGYLKDDISNAIGELKKLFDAKWFIESYPKHQMTRYLLYPKGPEYLSFVLSLGISIYTLGFNRLSKKMKEALRKEENFLGAYYELEVLAWLSKRVDELILEDELNFPKDKPKPDALMRKNSMEEYVEIKYLDFPKSIVKKAKRLNELLDTLFEPIESGVWIYQIDLGNPSNLLELDEAFQTVEEIIRSNKPPFEASKGRVSVKIKKAGEGMKAIFGDTVNDGGNELHELYRISDEIRDSGEKMELIEAESMILILSPSLPSIPFIFSLSDKPQEIIQDIFRRALAKNKNVKKIRQIWVDYSFIKGEKFVFFPFDNPFFEPNRYDRNRFFDTHALMEN